MFMIKIGGLCKTLIISVFFCKKLVNEKTFSPEPTARLSVRAKEKSGKKKSGKKKSGKREVGESLISIWLEAII